MLRFLFTGDSGAGYHNSRILIYQKLSYSQLIMPPWASDRLAIPDEPEDIDYQMEVSNRMKAAAFNTHGKVYNVNFTSLGSHVMFSDILLGE